MERKAKGPSAAQRRTGYVASALVSGVALWVAHRILGWGWLPFLTPAWNQVLPVLSASLIVGIVVDVLLLGYDGVWFKSPANVVVATVGIAASVRTWRVFPFDFSRYAFDWDAVARVLLVLSIVGGAIAIAVEVGRLARAAARG